MLSFGCVDLAASSSGPKCQVVSEHSGVFPHTSRGLALIQTLILSPTYSSKIK